MKRFSNILFVADSPEHEANAFDRAVALAKNNQARMTVIGLVGAADKKALLSDKATGWLLDAMVEERREELHVIVERAGLRGLQAGIKVLVGKEFIEIIREVL